MSTPINDGGAAEIKIIGGTVIRVSPCDVDFVSSKNWRIGSNGYVYIAGGRVAGKACLLHRIILSAPNGREVHHLDGDKLNNVRDNLCLVSASEHQRQFHKAEIITRNKTRRIHETHGRCKHCGNTFEKHRDHRGIQTVCSKACAIRLAVIGRNQQRFADAMLAERSKGGAK